MTFDGKMADRLTAIVLFGLGLAMAWGGFEMDRLEIRRIHPSSIPLVRTEPECWDILKFLRSVISIWTTVYDLYLPFTVFSESFHNVSASLLNHNGQIISRNLPQLNPSKLQ